MLRGFIVLIIAALILAASAMIQNGMTKAAINDGYPQEYMDFVKHGELMSILKRENPDRYYCGCQGCYHPLAQVCAYCCALNL